MTKGAKYQFRMSSKWKKFRSAMKKYFGGFDYITKQPLTKTWNLHHLDMRDAHYTDTSDKERFMPLNESTHDYIHYLYRLWVKDRNILKRIEKVLTLMYIYTHDTEDSNGNTDEASSAQ